MGPQVSAAILIFNILQKYSSPQNLESRAWPCSPCYLNNFLYVNPFLAYLSNW